MGRKRRYWIIKTVLHILCCLGLVFLPAVSGVEVATGEIKLAQAAPASPAPAASPVNATPTHAPATAPQLTPAQAEALQNLTPSQKAAAAQELGKTGGQLTPEAIKALQARPEFQGLTPEEVARGRELLQKQEAASREQETAPKPATQKQVIGEIAPGESLFDRARNIGSYQDISLDLKPFGHEFFREAAVKVITERRDIPVPLKYIVGPGDEVRLVMWGRINATHNLVVDRDGKIAVPNIGTIPVAGMTFEDMSALLIKQAQQITGTNVDISMGALRTIPIFIMGDVRRPGAYNIGASATITDALLLAGGPTAIGSMRKIQLRRDNRVIRTLDLYDFLLKGDKSQDVILRAGDIIFVPVIGPYVGIAGNVKRPALYELKDKSSLEHVIELAGGLIPSAFTQQIQVERTIKHEKRVVIDIDDKNQARIKTFLLQDADLVKVFNIVDKDVNVINLSGNVKRGGKYAFKPGMRLRDILKDEAELLPETYFDYALIKRIRPPDMSPKLVPFNLGDLLIKNKPEANLALQPLDSIFIFSKWFFQDRPFFTIRGEVRKPGRFDLVENFKVKDAILAAGDLTKDAYLKKGQIIRVDKKKQYHTLYFSPERALADDPQENLLLNDEDQIIIHSLYEKQWRETVSITGEVKNPQETLLTEGMRVSDLYFKAGGQTRDTLLEEAEIYRTDWRTKEVTLIKINLQKALEGDPEHNVLLRDLDRLVVHSIWSRVFKQTVTIAGEVQKPGNYTYAKNMRVHDLVFAAGNLLESASLVDAEISSQVIAPDGSARTVHRRINLGRAIAGDPEHNVILAPYDRLFVKRIPDWRMEKFATIGGEVLYPGKYPLQKGEKLSSLLERAGGFTEHAYLRGAVFTRERVREMQQKSLQEMADRLERDLLAEGAGMVATALSADEVTARKVEIEQKQKLIQTLRQLKATGRMTVHITQLSQLKDSKFDIELEEGDQLFIPPKNNVVNVAGAVMSQGSLIYSDEMSYEDFIEATGGYSRFADKKNVFVMKVDGSARKLSRGLFDWGSKRSRWGIAVDGQQFPTIEPGDTIVVPEKIDRIAWLREIRDITQIIMNVAVAAAVILKLW